MGRIKTVLAKRATKELIKRHGNEFSEDFTHNKEVLKKYVEIPSQKLRNVIAGYASRLVKQMKSGKINRKITPEDISKYY